MDGNECSYDGSYDGRKSVLPERVEVRVRSERRRRWSSKDKLAIVRETLAPGSVAQVVADRHGIGTGPDLYLAQADAEGGDGGVCRGGDQARPAGAAGRNCPGGDVRGAAACRSSRHRWRHRG